MFYHQGYPCPRHAKLSTSIAIDFMPLLKFRNAPSSCTAQWPYAATHIAAVLSPPATTRLGVLACILPWLQPMYSSYAPSLLSCRHALTSTAAFLNRSWPFTAVIPTLSSRCL